MPCYRPMKLLDMGFKPNGKRITAFAHPSDHRWRIYPPIAIPCGQCIGCRLQRSAEWALRCVHEAQLHDSNCFITLTYAPEHIPADGSLHKEHFQLFMKRFRKQVSPIMPRYYMCGEYGEDLGRPHYHAIIFGYDFPDKVFYEIKSGQRLYLSPSLVKLWPYGFHRIGHMSFEAAGYVARYCTKKITGKAASSHYGDRIPEYNQMSLKPGIAADWYAKYAQSDVWPHDYIIHEARKCRVPRYYSKMLELSDKDLHATVREARILAAQSRAVDLSPERLAVREQHKLLTIKRLKRTLEAT